MVTKSVPRIVSPGRGISRVRQTKSMLIDPTTTTGPPRVGMRGTLRARWTRVNTDSAWRGPYVDALASAPRWQLIAWRVVGFDQAWRIGTPWRMVRADQFWVTCPWFDWVCF